MYYGNISYGSITGVTDFVYLVLFDYDIVHLKHGEWAVHSTKWEKKGL